MSHSLTTITPVLKTLYLPGLNKHVYVEDFLQNECERRQQVEQVGRTFDVKVQTGFSHGISMGAPTDVLPDAGQTQFKNYQDTPKSVRGRIKINLTLVDYIKNDPHAALDLVGAEINGIKDAMKCYNEFQLVGNAGLTPMACVASVTTSTATVIVTVDDGGGVALCGTKYPTKYFLPGMYIDILAANYTSVSSTATESLQIADVPSRNTFTITCADASAASTLAGLLADGQTIFYQNGYNAEINGLKAMFGSITNTIHGAVRSTSTNSYLKPSLFKADGSGNVEEGAPTGTNQVNWSTLNVHEVMEYLVQTRHANENDLYIFCDAGVKAQYIQLKKAENGYFKEDVKIDGWPYKIIEAEGRPMLSPRYMFSNAMVFVAMNQLRKYKNRDIDFREDVSGQMWAKVANYDEVEAYLIGHWQYGCENYPQNALLGDLKGAYES